MPQALLVVAVGIAAGAAVAASMQPSAAQTDYSTNINTSGVNAEKPVVYGQAKTGAHKVFSEVVRSNSGDNDLLTVIYSLGEGPVHAINQLYIDDLPLFNNERDYTTGTIGQSDINYEFGRHVQVQVSNGEPEGFRFAMAEQNSDGRWKSTSTGNNVVSVCLKIKLDGYKGKIKSDNFNLTAKLKGVPVVDITKVDEPFVYQYNTSEQPGRNPALCLYDYLSNVAYGCAIEPEFLDKQSFIQAANWCDVNDLKVDGVVNQGQSYEENIKNLLTAFGGSIIDYNGDLYCVVDKPSVTVMDFDLSNTIGSIEIDYYPSENYFNQLETTWKDPSQNFKDDVVVYPPSIDDPTIQSDRFVKTNRLELPFTKNKANVDFLSSKFVKHAKSKTTITFTADVDGYLVQVSDVISMSNENRGWDKRLFRITEIERETFGDKVGQVKITATEYNEGVYVDSWVGDSTPVLTQPKSVPAVSDLAFNFKESRYGITGELTWNSTAYQIQETLVMYKLSAEPDTAFELYTKVEGSSCMFTSLKNNFYDFQVVNRDIFGATSQPTTIRNVDLVDNTVFPAVTGLTTLPLNTPDFVFNWDDMMDVDVSVVDAMNPSVIGQGKVKDYFFCYEVKMKVNGNAVSTHSVTNNSFTYTYDLNVKDGLSRDVTAEVCIVGVAGAKSQLVSYRAINLQQQVPNGIVVTGGQANLFIAFDAPTETDHKGTEIHVSTTRDFTPSPLTLLSDLSSNTFTFTTMNPNTYFVRLGAYDVFDRNNIVYSNQYETSIVSVESQLEAISKDQLNVDLFNEISGKSTQADINAAIATIPDVDTSVIEAATALVARNLVDAEAKATADLASAKAELQQAIDEKTVDLSPINTRIAQVEKQSKDANKAYAARMSSVETKANKQQASIDSIERSVSTNTSSLATKITSVEAKTIADSSAKTTGDAALQEAKQSTAASITTEKNARTTADRALSARINTVTAVANKNKADITTVEQSVVDTEQALATKINTVKAEASTEAANKANAAKVSAITIAAATAQAKATKALNDAKADTTGKVSATQIESARDAKDKADAALVAAKAEAKKLTDAAIATSNSHSDAVITNERIARTTADKALSTRIDTNKAKTDKAAADIIVTNTAIVGNEAAMASKVIAMESSVKTDSTNKANQALADAKSYANTKKDEANSYAETKFTEAVNTASTALAAEASKVSTLEAKMNYVSDAAETPDNGDMLINGRMTKKDKDGRPLGWYAAYSNSNHATIGFDSSGAFLMSTSDSSTGMSSNAFRVEKNTTYKIKIKVKAQTAATSGFYCWFYEYDAELPKGKFAISNAGGEAAVQEDTRIIQAWTNKTIGTSWETHEFTYTPTSSAVFTSVGFLNWSGMGSNNKLYVDYCTITADKTVYIDSKYTDAVNIINTKDSAQTTARNILQSTVNGLSSSVTSTSSALATLDGKVKSTWAMRVDANGKVAGIGLSNDGTSSSFAINADDFLIYDGTSDKAVFAVTDGKLLVKNAMIGELDASNIKAGAITAAHLDVNALDAVDAKIENATINFAQITGTMQSGGFVAGSSGWQITQTGGAEFNDALFRGRIESSYIKGAFIEGGIFVGGTDFTVATQADTGSGVRYLAFATASGSSSNNANVGWSGYTVSNLASANYTGDGTVNYEGKTAYKNFARARKYAMQGNGSITFKKPPAGTNYRDNGAWSHLDSSGSYQVAFRIRVLIQIVGYTKAGALTIIGNFTVFDVTRNVQDWNGRVSVPHGSVTSSVSTKRSSWLTTYKVNSISCTLTSLPDFNFSGNYNRIGYRIFTESAPVNHPRAKGAGQHSSFTFKSK